jgi:hypothetical protein
MRQPSETRPTTTAETRPTTTADVANISRRVKQLATERADLFDKAGARFGLSAAEQARLHDVERQLDECFLARRQQRAVRDATRFDHRDWSPSSTRDR